MMALTVTLPLETRPGVRVDQATARLTRAQKVKTELEVPGEALRGRTSGAGQSLTHARQGPGMPTSSFVSKNYKVGTDQY